MRHRPFNAAAADFKHRPGPVHDHLSGQMNEMLGFYMKAIGHAIEAGELKAETDPGQMAFDLWSIILGYEQFAHMLKRPDARANAMKAFETLIDRNKS